MKYFLYIITFFLSWSIMISPVSAVDVNDIDLTTGNISNENTSVNNNQALKAIQDKNIFWGISNGGER